MYNEQIEALISEALADGVLTEKEKQILFKKAESMGIDLDEFELILDVYKRQPCHQDAGYFRIKSQRLTVQKSVTYDAKVRDLRSVIRCV